MAASDTTDEQHAGSGQAAYVGKICPYCRFAITAADRVTVCKLCLTPHHSSCWYENGRCTTYGCRGVADRLEAALPPEYRGYYDLPGLGRPRIAEPVSPKRWTLLALGVLAPAILLAAVMFRYGWLLVGSLVAVVIISALIHHWLDQPEAVGRRDLLPTLASLALSVIGIAFIALTVVYAPQ